MHTFKILLILFFLGFPADHVLGFSTHNTSTSRTFDKVQTTINDFITITIEITNLETSPLRGFYYTEQIPEGMSVHLLHIKIDGAEISSYLSEIGSAGEVYPGSIPYRWTMEAPPSFADNNPVSNNSTLEIVYTASSAQAATFQFNEFHWVGYYQDAPEAEKPAFGHSEDHNNKTLTFINHNQPPVLDPIGSKNIEEIKLLEFTITATDPEDDILSFSATNLPPGASFNPVTHTFSWTPRHGDAATYDLLFEVTDDGIPPLSDQETVTCIVQPDATPPPVPTDLDVF